MDQLMESNQQKIAEGQKDLEKARIHFREVKSENSKEITTKTINSESEMIDVQKLLSYIREKKLRYPKKISSSEMEEAHRDFVENILENSEEYNFSIKYLISQFCDKLKKRQREKGKYAMVIHYGDSFLLTHVRVEKALSINEEDESIDLVRRFLDVDNILSAALFEKENKEIKFSHFTDTGSESFRKFLGVTNTSDYNFSKKNVQIKCYYSGQKGINCTFNFSNEELEQKLVYEDKIQISQNKLKLEEDGTHHIKEILWGNETYQNPKIFLSDLKEWSYNISGHKRRYNELKSHGKFSVYDEDNEVIDRKDEIQVSSEETTTWGKNVDDDTHLLFAGNHIDIDSEFARKIFESIIYGEKAIISHISSSTASKELKIGELTLLNLNRNEISVEMLEFLKDLYRHINNSTGESVKKCLGLVFLKVLSREVSDQMESAIDQIINLNTGRVRNKDVVTTKETPDGIIEFKDKGELEKKRSAESIADNIDTKVNPDSSKIFLFGIDEETKKIEGLRKQKWDEDRLTGVQNKVESKLDDKKCQKDFEIVPVPLGETAEKLIAIGTVT